MFKYGVLVFKRPPSESINSSISPDEDTLDNSLSISFLVTFSFDDKNLFTIFLTFFKSFFLKSFLSSFFLDSVKVSATE